MNSRICKSFLILLILQLPFFCACRNYYPEKIPPEAINGVLDLTDWDFEKDGPVELTGEYEFYWKQHLDPAEFSKATPPQKTGFIWVPGYWNGYEVEGKELPGEGFATYRLKILSNAQKEPLALKLLEMSTAGNVYVNGKMLTSVGVAGKNRETTVPYHFSQIVDFELETNQMEIIFQISNFHHRRGGAWEVIRLGREKDIRQNQERSLGFDLFVFGSIFIMALYHLGLFVIRKIDRSPFFFGIFCFLMALRLFTTGERFLIHLLPSISWEIVIKLEYLSFYLAVPAFSLFLQSLFPKFSKRLVHIIVILGVVFSCIVLFTPARLFSYTLNIYEIITILALIYSLYVIFVSFSQKRIEAFIILLGFIILSLTVINDMLHVERIIQTGLFAPFGMFIFILSQAFLLSFSFSRALTTVEAQRSELKDTLESYKREIIGRVQAEEALRESEEKYRTILQSIEEGYYEVDLAGNMTFFNDSLCKMVGFPKDELMGMNNRQYMSEETAKKFYKTFNEVFRTGKAAKSIIWETIRKDGKMTVLELSVSLMRDAEGQATGFRGIARDITERKKAEEQARLHQQQLMHAGKMVALGTLVSGVAHEINNPNNFIMLNSPILKEAWENAIPILESYYEENGDFILGGMQYTEMRENIPALFSGISDGAKRIKQIVDDLKNYVRDDTADLTQAVDLNEVLTSAISLVSNMIKKSTNHFEVEYGKNLPLLKGNFQRLEQVAINLIQNACQALASTNKGIFVSTSYDNQTSHVVIRVKDEGTGIPSETLSQITDPFFTTKHDSGGVGLGLSISARIVEEHGGSIHFTSEPGLGTTVEIILPVNRENHTTRGIKND